MELDRYLRTLQDALSTAAQTSSAEVQEAAERLARTMESTLRLTLMEFAADLADQVTVKLDGDSVEVRFRSSGPEVVVTPNETHEVPEPPEPPAPPPAPAEDGDISRISLRLPESLKAQVEQAATTQGLSTNAWLVRAAQSALNPPPTTRPTATGRRMTGWVR